CLCCASGAIAPALGGWGGELGSPAEPGDWPAFLAATFGTKAHFQSLRDDRNGRRAFALIENGRLVAALYTSPDPVLVSRQWAAGLLRSEEHTSELQSRENLVCRLL